MENNTVLILSWCDADDVMNYGQILQACAMMYNVRKIVAGKIIYVSFCPRGFKGKAKYILKHMNPVSKHLQAYIKTKKNLNNFIKTNTIRYYQISDERTLNRIAEEAQILICGSDQIWHPQNYNKNYFLNFGNIAAKRVSFAASLPKTQIEPQFKEEMNHIAKQLQKIDKISVREHGSKAFISRISGKNVEHVLDPTFLVPVQIWERYVEKIDVPSNYIFIYIPNGMDKGVEKLLKELKKLTGISNVLILMTRGKNEFSNVKVMKFVSLGQFLYLIKNAAYVFTSSFHAVVFSTIFHTNFYCYDVPNVFRGEDIRLRDILDILGLEDRQILKKEDIKQRLTIDYAKVERRLSLYKKYSWEFLKGLME